MGALDEPRTALRELRCPWESAGLEERLELADSGGQAHQWLTLIAALRFSSSCSSGECVIRDPRCCVRRSAARDRPDSLGKLDAVDVLTVSGPVRTRQAYSKVPPLSAPRPSAALRLAWEGRLCLSVA